MNDFYTEQLVKRKTTGTSILLKGVMMGLTVVSFIIGFVLPFGLILPILLITADVFVFRSQNLEYEYLYVNGDLDIDKIMGKAKRKRIFSSTVDELEMLAPSGSDEVSRIQVNKVYNYSSHENGKKTYDLIVTQNGQKVKVIFEPNDIILNGYKMLAPRKVVI